MKYILGIDPGLTGAIALLDFEGNFCELAEIPTMIKGQGTGVVKRCINSVGLQNIISSYIAEYGDLIAYIENVNAMPGQGVSSVFSLGDTFGVIRSVLACLGIESYFIPPQTWKKYFKLPADKDVCRSYAIKVFPQAAIYLNRKADHNKAEALLLAKYGTKQR